MFWLTFAAAVLLGVYVAVRVSIALIAQNSVVLSVRKVSIYAANCDDIRACVTGIAARLNIAPGTRHIDLNDALSRVAADPDIAQVGVRRMPNGEIKVRAKMRIVVASWTDGESFYPLDAEGKMINRRLAQRPENTLVFSGNVPGDISKISAALKRAPELFSSADRLEFIESRRWDIFLKNGIRVMLPQENWADAIKKIEELHKQNMILDRKIKQLDMRDTARPLVIVNR
jgi:cell division protein FtsQ